MSVAVHEVTKACYERHCFSHNVDEPVALGERIYICCAECGHVYRTARELRRAYRRAVLQWPTFGIDRLTALRCALTIRAKRIYFCQECIHDF